MGKLALLAVVAILSLANSPIFAKKCKVNTAYRQTGLDVTNKYRAKHKDTPAMTLDDKMSGQAQECAQMLMDTDQFDHICETDDGENLAMGGGNADQPPEDLITQAVDMWYAEIKNYSYATPEKPKGTVGHFTQLVWKTSTKLGLGLAIDKKKNEWIAVGRFNPPGNYQGENKKNVMPLK